MRWVLQRWELKLLSLVVAFVLWVFVVGGEKSQIMLSARVEYVNVPSGLMLAGSVLETVDVQVQGLRSSLARLTPDDLRAEVDLARLGAGEAVIRLAPDNVRTARDVAVLRVSPSRLRVTLEPIETVEVTVAPRLTGRPKPGYVVRGVSVRPPTVTVSGPGSEVARRPEIQTLPIDVSGAQAPLTRSVDLAPEPGAVRLSKTRTVEVTVDITEERGMPQKRTVR